MSGREAVLGKVRRALGAGPQDETRRAAVAERLAAHARNTVPARGQLAQDGRIALFTTMAERVAATVDRVADADDLPTWVAAYLRRHNLPLAIRTGEEAALAALPWSREPHLQRSVGPSAGDDLVSLSMAFAGVAESGTLVLLSGPDNPTTLNFLPDTHIVALLAEDIAGDYETVWARIRDATGGGLPRTVNFVTGPSRSADIEQTLILGAHGPRALHIVIIG